MTHHRISADAFASLPWKGVVRRDGAVAPFDAGRICYAIARAGRASGQFEEDEAARLTGAVLAALLARFPQGQLEIEDIQDEVEWTLMREGQLLTARAYVIYRAQRTKIRHDRRAAVDAVASINEYLDRQDWRVQANANQGYSLGGLILNSAG
jgi:ribonucleoside-triphosphate reductase